MTRCFRLASARYPAASGAGAAKYGGRWNPSGVEAIYTAATISLAALEVLVHHSVLPQNYVSTEIWIPSEAVIEQVSAEDLPTGWTDSASIDFTQRIGRVWHEAQHALALQVPSAVVASEWNYVLNPSHPRFSSATFSDPVPFHFDPRLK